MDGSLKTPELGCLWGTFTLKADPWPQRAVRQMPGRHLISDARKTPLFPSLFQHDVPGDGIYVSDVHREQRWGPGCTTGGGNPGQES